eukprot:gene27531-61969_t
MDGMPLVGNPMFGMSNGLMGNGFAVGGLSPALPGAADSAPDPELERSARS